MSILGVDNLTDRLATFTVPMATVGQGVAKSWTDFNGTGTIAARDSFNVSSLTDNGTGDYTVTFSTALPNANYAPLFGCSSPGAAVGISQCPHNNAPATTDIRVRSLTTAFAAADFTYDIVSVHGDPA